ncbi:MAG: NDP-sugar synthase [Armatimonadota bacterium]
MQAVILVGGEGTRLRPLTYDIPKPMAPIMGKPYLEHLIERLKEAGITEIVLATCFKYDFIKDYFGDGERFGVKIFYEIEEEPLGTAGAVKNVEKHITGTFLAFNGDVMIDIDFRKLILFHNEKGGAGTLTLTKVEDPTRYGIIETNDDKSIRKFIEKPKPEEITTNYINAGVYVLEKKVLDLMDKDVNYSFEKQIFPQILASDDNLYAYHNQGYWIDIGKPESYKQVHFDILEGKFKVDLSGYNKIKDNVWIGKNVVLDNNAQLGNFIFINDGAVIKEGARLGHYCVIDKDCVIEEGAEISKTILWPGVKLGRNTGLYDCIIGRFTVIEDNAISLQGDIIGSREIINKV